MPKLTPLIHWLTPTRLVLTILAVIFLGALYYLRFTLLPFWLALFAAYALSPLIDKWQKKVGRGGAIAILMGIVLIFCTLLLLYLIPAISGEIALLRTRMPTYFAALKQFNQGTINTWFENTLHMSTPFSFSAIESMLEGQMEAVLAKVAALVNGGLRSAIAGTVGAVQLLLDVFLFFFFLTALLADFPKVKRLVMECVPPRYREKTAAWGGMANETLSHFFRGQFTVAFILAVCYSLGLSLLGVDMAIFLGLMSGLLFLVPYVGLAIAVSSSLALAFLNFSGFGQILGIVLLYAIMPLIETLVLTPRITGSKLVLSPAMVILSILIFSGLFGFIGLIFALPAAALLKMIVQELFVKYKNSGYYLGEEQSAS